MAKRGAKSIFDAASKGKLVAALKAIKGMEGYAEPSYYHKRQLAEQNYIAFDAVKTGARGRPQYRARVTNKGQALINFNPNV